MLKIYTGVESITLTHDVASKANDLIIFKLNFEYWNFPLTVSHCFAGTVRPCLPGYFKSQYGGSICSPHSM